MKKLYTLLTVALLSTMPLSAAESEDKVKCDLYGFFRSDFYYDSRATTAALNDLFLLYPLDVELDSAGEDLNASSNSGFVSISTRLGLNVSGGRVGSATASGKIEADFGGFGTNTYVIRLRHAYFNLRWEGGSSFTVGQTWHPMFGTVYPYMANLSTGAPFQPFSRAPQLRYEYRTGGWNFLASALYQLQNCSAGESGFTNEYQRDGCIPEFYGGFDYTYEGLQIGGGVDILTIAPRIESEYNGETFKVNERMTSMSAELHARYKHEDLTVAMKSIYASSMESTNMISGYGVSAISSETGERSYTPLNSSSTWINVVYGNMWRPYIFVGYVKNLGSSDPLVSSDLIFGRGIGIDQMVGANIGLNYNIKSFHVNVEYANSSAWYGDINLDTGRVVDTHRVTNNRITLTFAYHF